jgi:hypothetical protein
MLNFGLLKWKGVIMKNSSHTMGTAKAQAKGGKSTGESATSKLNEMSHSKKSMPSKSNGTSSKSNESLNNRG